MSIRGLVVAGGRVYQELDLSDVFGVSFDGQEALKLAIGQEIVDYMRKRTEGGKDYNGRSLAKYSKSYKESEEFEAFNKSSNVNMSLRGDMMASIDFETSGSNFTFLFDDAEEETKAFGHMSGMEGHKVLDGKAPKRLFFGISDEELETKIFPKFRSEIEAMKASPESAAFMTLEEALGLTAGSGSGGISLEDLLRDL